MVGVPAEELGRLGKFWTGEALGALYREKTVVQTCAPNGILNEMIVSLMKITLTEERIVPEEQGGF